MANPYRDKKGQFASGGSGGKGSAARKAALSKQVSFDLLTGKKVSSDRKNYVSAQNAEKQRIASQGKGNKAAKRAAAVKAAKSPKQKVGLRVGGKDGKVARTNVKTDLQKATAKRPKGAGGRTFMLRLG